jgi:hypothetical protein
MNPDITLTELEAAINFWRKRSPSLGDEQRLCPEAGALATPYALLIMQKQSSVSLTELDPLAQSAIEQWRQAK